MQKKRNGEGQGSSGVRGRAELQCTRAKLQPASLSSFYQPDSIN